MVGAMSGVLLWIVVGTMLLGMLAVTVWVFSVVFSSAKGIAKTVAGGPESALRGLGLATSSNPAGGSATGHWNGTSVIVRWRMETAGYVGPTAGPPAFTTVVTASYARPLGCGMDASEAPGAAPIGVPGLDGAMTLQATDITRARSLLGGAAGAIGPLLAAPGLLHIGDEAATVLFREIVEDPPRLRTALDHVTYLARGFGG